MPVGTQDLKFNVLARVLGADAITQLGGNIQNLSDKADFLGKGLKALGALYSVDKIKEFATGVLETADSLYKLSQKTGISVQDLSALKGAAEVSGVPFDALTGSLRKLSVNMIEATSGNQKIAAAFKSLGVTVKDANGNLKSGGDVVKELADKFANIKDGPQKAAVAVALFGKTGSEIIPLLNRGSAAIEEFTTSIDQDFGARAEAFNDSIAIISKNLKAGAIDGIKELLPTLQEIAEAFSAFTKTKTETVGFADVVGEAFRRVAEVGILVYDSFKLVTDQIITGYKEIASIFNGGDALALDRALEERTKKLQRDEEAFLAKINKNSLLFGKGTTDEILKRQRDDTAPEIKKPTTEIDPDSLGKNAKTINEFEVKLAKMRAEAQTYGATNSAKEQAILLAELESKGVLQTSAAYQKLSAEITETVEARESAKEKNTAKEFQKSQERQIELDALSLEQINMSTVEYNKLTTARKLDNAALEATKNFTVEGTVAYFEATEAIKNERLALIDLEQQQRETWSTGAKQALKDYAENAKDVASQVKTLFSTAFKDMEDALVSFIKGGTLDFKKFADDIVTEIIRIQVKMAIAQTATGASGLFASFFGGSSGSAPASSTVGESTLDTSTLSAGGNVMTSAGPMALNKYASGGIARSPQLSIFGEGRQPEAYVPLPDGRSIPVTMKDSQGKSGGNVTVSVSVNVEKGQEDVQSQDKSGAALGKMIAAAIKNQILQEKRPGGLLA